MSIPEGSPVLCEHANECPATCPCGPECYCKSHTCKVKFPEDRDDKIAAEEEEKLPPNKGKCDICAKKFTDKFAVVGNTDVNVRMEVCVGVCVAIATTQIQGVVNDSRLKKVEQFLKEQFPE